MSFGNFCSIASGLKIISGQHPPIEYPGCVTQFPFADHDDWKANYYPSKMGGKVIIENDSWIGEDVTLLEGTWISNGAIIGAKSVVRGTVPAYTIVVGNPWEIVRYRFTTQQIMDLEDIAWWNWNDDKLKKAIPDMKNIDSFIAKYKIIV